MHGFGLVDEIVPEPDGGAHWNYDKAAEILKQHIINALNEYKNISANERINNRIAKYEKMGFWNEVTA